MKKPLFLILALVLCFVLAAPALADDSVSVTVNGKAVEWTDAQPFIDEDALAIMVPLRAVAGDLGLQVVWYAAEREAAFTDGNKVIYFPIGSSTASAFGSGDVAMEISPVIVNDRIYAPVSYLARFFGCEVDWDEETGTVSIMKGNSADFVCGETEPHQWKAANYQAPETCAVCGATQGEALTPDFVTYGIKADLEAGKHYNAETDCSGDPGRRTVVDLTVLDCSIIRSDDTHEAKDGYEWRVVTFQFVFEDEDGWNDLSVCSENYYDIRLNDDTTVDVNDDGSVNTFTVNYYGEDMECIERQEWLSYDVREDGSVQGVYSVSYQVPVGHDGCVYGFCDSAVEWPDGAYIFDIYAPDAFYLFHLASLI